MIFGVGVILIALAAATGEFFTEPACRGPSTPFALLLILALAQIHLHGALRQFCHRETSYYCIRVTTERMADGHVFRVMSLDRLIHSYNSLEEPTRRTTAWRTYAELTAYAAQRSPRLRALFVGGSGYTCLGTWR